MGHARGTVSNNIAYGNPGFGIHCWQACDELVIANNLVFDNGEGGIVQSVAPPTTPEVVTPTPISA